MRDKAYLAFIRQQPCCIPNHDCQGPIDAHHAQKRSGMGLKASDHDTLPMSRQGPIYERHALAGYFQGWAKDRVKAWESEMIAKYRDLYLSGPGSHGQPGPVDF
jgi:hypothetical protein